MSLLKIPLGMHPITNDEISSAVLVATVGGPLSEGNNTHAIMLEVLSMHDELNMTKWMELCKEQQINRREFRAGIQFIAEEGKDNSHKGKQKRKHLQSCPRKTVERCP